MDGGMGDPDSGRDAGMMDVDAGRLPTDPPSTFTEVVSTGFTSPTDAVSSADGSTFYFAAFDPNGDPAIFSVDGTGGAAMVRHAGLPLEYPSGLVMGCDDETLYIADPVADPDGDGTLGAIFSIGVSGAGDPTPVAITGLAGPNALALNYACDTLFISGHVPSGAPAVLSAPTAGGAATVVRMGDPFRALTGIHVDPDDTVWVLDHLADEEDGMGVLYSITSDGTLSTVVSGLLLGTPGGVSLAAGGGTAIIGSRDANGAAVLTTVNASTLAVSTVALPAAFVDPAGLRTARSVGVFVFVDSEGSAIYRGE